MINQATNNNKHGQSQIENPKRKSKLKIEFNFKPSLLFTAYSLSKTELRPRRQSNEPAHKCEDKMPLKHCRNEEIKNERNK